MVNLLRACGIVEVVVVVVAVSSFLTFISFSVDDGDGGVNVAEVILQTGIKLVDRSILFSVLRPLT